MKRRMLPLGVDLGEGRVRVAALSADSDGRLHVEAAYGVDVAGEAHAALSTAFRQIGTRERRCVAMIRAASARLRCVKLPSMSKRETERAAHYEVAGLFEASEPIVVRAAYGEEGTLVAAAPKREVANVLSTVSRAGLRAVWLDHEACALARMSQLPLLDIGLARSTLVRIDGGVLKSDTLPGGGSTFTLELARELGISREQAEARKRSIGLGGAARDAMDAFAAAIVERAPSGLGDALYVTGNGARLPGLREHLSAQLGIRIVSVGLSSHLTCELPVEVERSGLPDWFGAIAAALPRSNAGAAWTV